MLDTKIYLGILVAIDFEKAFDSLNFDFLLRVLHAFNFGPSFIQWIWFLYNIASSCVMWEGYSDMPNLCNTIKILGVYFGYDAKQRDELNFRNTLKSLKKTINLWKWRGLSPLGRNYTNYKNLCHP